MVLFVDVDDFKLVNDNHGHRTGDEALKLVAGILRSCSRRMDVVARHGGDEFMVMLPGASLPEAHRFFDRMRGQVVERSRSALGLDLRISAGAVQVPRPRQRIPRYSWMPPTKPCTGPSGTERTACSPPFPWPPPSIAGGSVSQEEE